MSTLVKYECLQGVALIAINNPPVNALSHGVRNGLLDSIRRFEEDEDAQIAVLYGTGRLFISGADISEFGQSPQPPHLPDVILQIERCDKPIVAAIHGVALGGGLEVAMGAHYRVAHGQAKLGMPEVKLGLIPGAGGTQRLPRLVGVDNALKLITGGNPIDASDALQMGLIDRIATDEDVSVAGIAFAREIVLGMGPGSRVTTQPGERSQSTEVLPRRTGDMSVEPASESAMKEWRKTLTASAHGEIASLVALDAIEASTTLSFAQGLQEERRLFSILMDSPERAGLIHAFFAERKVAKLAEISNVKGKDIAHIGVIGGGTMGAGIATTALLGGYTVTLIEKDTPAANAARSTIENNLDGAVKRGKLDIALRHQLEKIRLVTSTHYHSLADADLIIEAVFEEMDIKKQVFQAMDAAAKPDAILATNTSYLDINEIAASTNRPESVLGLHFFSPAHVMKLLEVVVADKTSPELIATGFSLARRLGKIAVRAGVCDGFIGNRLLTHYRTAADHMVLDGASPYQVDKALTDYGFAMGPYAVADLAGLDIGYAARQRRTPFRHPRERHPGWADDLYHEGRLGRKTGKGYYLYSAGSSRGAEDPHVEELVAQTRHEAGITPRAFSDEEIVTRYLCAMINEAARLLDEGIATRPSDIDVVLLFGYGYPRRKGGPMHTADQLGLPAVLRNIQLFAQDDDFFWQSAPLLEQLVAQDRNFNSLN